MAVITTFELDDLVPPGESTGETQTRHGRLRAAVHHSYLFDGWNPAADQLRHFDFKRIRDPEADAALGGGANRVDDHCGRMTQDRRAPGADVIDVFVAVDIPN